MKTRTFLAIILSVFVVSIAGCASMRAATAERQYINRATANYVHERDLQAVFPVARKILFEEGFQVRDSTGNSLETEYLRQRDEDVRYLVTATKSGNGWRITFTRDVMNTRTQTATTSRDLLLEWDLIGHVDPKWRDQVQREAQAAGVAAGKS